MKTIMNFVLVIVVAFLVANNACLAEIVQGDEIKVEMVHDANSISPKPLQTYNPPVEEPSSLEKLIRIEKTDPELIEVLKEINRTLKEVEKTLGGIAFILLLILLFKNCSK